MVHVLVTNDDGPPGEASPYIQSFVKQLKESTDWEISIAVPHTQRSWVGKAHLINESVYPTYLYIDYNTGATEGPFEKRIPEKENFEWVLLSGTPASCTNIGLHHMFQNKGPIDLVLSGPNFGRNSTALYIMSSGTVGAAMEGALCGVKSIGLSYAFETREHDPKQIAEASKVSVKLAKYLYENWDPDTQLYSVNVPIYQKNLAEAKIVYVPILQNQWGSAFESWDVYSEASTRSVTPANAEDETIGFDRTPAKTDQRPHYRWRPDFDAVNKTVAEAGPDNDGWALAQGYIAVTPLRATFHCVKKGGEIKI